MSEYVYAGTGLPAYDKTNARDVLAGFSQSYIAASEWNSLVTCVTNLKSALLSGAWHGLGDGTGVAVSASGLMRIRQVGGVLQISYNGGAYSDLALTTDIPESSVSTGLTGVTAYAGGGQASATALTADVNFVTTCATHGDSVKLPTASLGKVVTVRNDGAKSVAIFPQTGGSIASCGTNAARYLPKGCSLTFYGQSSTAWKTEQTDGRLNVLDYGATGDGATDDYAAIQAAVTAAARSATISYFAGLGSARVYIPPGKYRTSATIMVYRATIIEGDGGFYGGTWTTVLHVDAGVKGIHFYGVNTEIDATQSTSSGSELINVGLISGAGDASAYSGGTTTAHGVHVQAQVKIERCCVQGFYGTGIRVEADVPAANANNFQIRECSMFANSQYGYHCSGGDTNAGIIQSCSIIGNRRWGAYENCFLGNTWIANNFADNGYGNILATNANARNVFIGTYFEGGTNDRSLIQYPSKFIHGIGTSAAGTGFGTDDSAKGQIFNVTSLPPTDGKVYPASSMLRMVSSGDFAIALDGCYSLAAYTDGRTALVTGTTDEDGDDICTLSGTSSQLFPGVTIVLGAISYRRIKEAVGTRLVLFNSGEPITNHYTAGNSYSISCGGDAVYDLAVHKDPRDMQSFRGGMRLGTIGASIKYANDNTMRHFDYGSAAPASGTWLVGDVRLNNAQAADGVMGWACTVAGTPGTWTALPRLTGGAGDSTGSPGNATLNTSKGRSAFAASSNVVVITNSLVTTSSIINAMVQTIDANLTQIINVTPSNGSFTVHGNAAALGTTNFCWNIVE